MRHVDDLMVTITTDGHCPVCQGPTTIEVRQVDANTSTFTCVKHPQFSHRLTLPTAVPFGYTVVSIADGTTVASCGLVWDTPQEAADACDNFRGARDAGDAYLGRRFAVATVTLIEDLA